MSLAKGSEIERGYATIIGDEGVNYREVAETMTELGFPMNHSSARNNVLRIMRKFMDAILKEYEIKMSDERINEVIKSPSFQRGIADMLHVIEARRRDDTYDVGSD